MTSSVHIETRHEPEPAAGAAALAAAWADAARRRWTALGRLGLAEARLAVLSVAAMFFFAMLAAVFTLSAWGLINVLIVLALVEAGAPVPAVVAGLLCAQIAGAYLCWNHASRLTRHIEFPQTRRVLNRHVAQETTHVEQTAATAR